MAKLDISELYDGITCYTDIENNRIFSCDMYHPESADTRDDVDQVETTKVKFEGLNVEMEMADVGDYTQIHFKFNEPAECSYPTHPSQPLQCNKYL